MSAKAAEQAAADLERSLRHLDFASAALGSAEMWTEAAQVAAVGTLLHHMARGLKYSAKARGER